MTHLRSRGVVPPLEEGCGRTAVLIIALCLALSACGTGPPEPEPEPQPAPDAITAVDFSDVMHLLDPCAAGYPDVVFEVPEHKDFPASGRLIRISTQDTYWYGLYHQHHKDCRRYVADIKFNEKSNRQCLPDGGGCTYGAVLLYPDAYNLPSSDGWHHDGTIPAKPRDCNAYEIQVRFYEKLAGAASFTFLEEKVFQSGWNYQTNSCDVVPLPGDGNSGIVQSGEGRSAQWDTYRLATKVMLRGLPQQARVVAAAYVPPPL